MLTANPTPTCAYPPCSQPLPPSPTGRPRRFCTKRCFSRDYEARHPGRKQRQRTPRPVAPPPTGVCACGCGVPLALRQWASGETRFPQRYVTKACANRHYQQVAKPHVARRERRNAVRRAARAAAADARGPRAPKPRGYYDLPADVIEQRIARALAYVQWRNARDRMARP